MRNTRVKIGTVLTLFCIASFSFAHSQTPSQISPKSSFNINRFSFDIKINAYPSCLPNGVNILDFDSKVDDFAFGIGCLDFAEFEVFTGRLNAKEEGEDYKYLPSFAFDFSNRTSFAKMGSKNPFHKYVYFGTEFSLNNMLERDADTKKLVYSAALMLHTNFGLVFPITSFTPAEHSMLAYGSKANVNFNFILEFGLGVEYYSYFSANKLLYATDEGYSYTYNSRNPHTLHLSPTFSILTSMSFAKLPNLELEGGLRVLPGWRLDLPIRMQYDFYETDQGVKLGLVANYDLWFLNGGLGLALRY